MTLVQHAFGQVIERVFVHKEGDRNSDLSPDEVREHITAVKYEGSSESMVALIIGFSRLLRNSVARNERLGVQEARDAVIEGFVEAVCTFNLNGTDGLPRCAMRAIATKLGLVSENLQMIRLPHETVRRYFRIWNMAGQDINVAATLAQEQGMERETLLAIHAVLTFAPMPDREAGYRSLYVSPRDEHTTDDLDFYVEKSEEVCTLEEWTVLRYKFGFVTGDELDDGSISQAWSEDILGPERVANGQYVASRAKVQRLRVSAISKIREALGIEV